MLRSILYDIDRGRDSDYPPCCIAWFALVWGRLSDVSQRSERHLTAWNKYVWEPYDRFIKFGLKVRKKDENMSWHRIPCPKCALMNEPRDLD